MTSHLGEDGASNRVILKVRLTWWYGRKRLDQMMILTGDSSSIFTKVLDFLSLVHKLFQTQSQTNWQSVCLFVCFKDWALDWPIRTLHRASILSFERENPIKFFVYFTILSFSKNLGKVTFEENQDFSQKRKCLPDFPLCWVFPMSQTAEESK